MPASRVAMRPTVLLMLLTLASEAAGYTVSGSGSWEALVQAVVLNEIKGPKVPGGATIAAATGGVGMSQVTGQGQLLLLAVAAGVEVHATTTSHVLSSWHTGWPPLLLLPGSCSRCEATRVTPRLRLSSAPSS